MEEELVSFTALDRCDRCGAQAVAQAAKKGLTELLFCRHHKREHEDALLENGWTVTEDAEQVKALVSTPGGSAW